MEYNSSSRRGSWAHLIIPSDEILDYYQPLYEVAERDEEFKISMVGRVELVFDTEDG